MAGPLTYFGSLLKYPIILLQGTFLSLLMPVYTQLLIQLDFAPQNLLLCMYIFILLLAYSCSLVHKQNTGSA